MFKLHVIALLLGTILEVFIGRIYSIWNPFDSITNWVKYLDRALLGDDLILLEPSKQKSFGLWLIILTLTPVIVLTAFFVLLTYEISPVLGVIFEAIATYYCLDANYTYYTAQGIMKAYYGDGINAMRHETSTFTGLDTSEMEEEELTKAVITKVANEAGDSSLSSLLLMFLFGPIGGFIYRTIDLMDNLVAHHSPRYEYFGFYVAKLNRIVDYIPGRFSGLLAVFAARHTFGEFNGKNARFINLRDRFKAIGAFAGALDTRLKDNTIGDDDVKILPSDISRAIALHRNMFIICQCVLVILLVFF